MLLVHVIEFKYVAFSVMSYIVWRALLDTAYEVACHRAHGVVCLTVQTGELCRSVRKGSG